MWTDVNFYEIPPYPFAVHVVCERPPGGINEANSYLDSVEILDPLDGKGWKLGKYKI